MASTIITETAVTEIWVSRDFSTYTHKIYRNGILQSAHTISPARAQEIVAANPDGRVRGLEPVDFGPGAKQFTWIAQVEDGEDGN